MSFDVRKKQKKRKGIHTLSYKTVKMIVFSMLVILVFVRKYIAIRFLLEPNIPSFKMFLKLRYRAKTLTADV